MLNTEKKICRKCKKEYMSFEGGTINLPIEKKDNGLCPECRNSEVIKKLEENENLLKKERSDQNEQVC